MHEKHSEIEKKETEENQANKERGTLPVIPRNDANSYHAGKPNYEGKEPQKSRWKRRWVRSKRWFRAPLPDWIQVIFALAIVYFAWSSGEETRRIMTAAEKNADAAASFAKSSDDIRQKIGKAEGDFEKMANSSEESIKETRRAFQIEQRAWVGFSGIGDKPELGKPYTITVQFGNTGRTPAIGIRSQIMSVPIPRGQEPDFTYADPPESQAVLQPNGQFIVSWKATKVGEVFNQATLESLKSGTVRLYVYGHVSYDDVFGGQHWTRFCLHLRGDMDGFTHCKKYNEIDRN
jgi:hypothetical protein